MKKKLCVGIVFLMIILMSTSVLALDINSKDNNTNINALNGFSDYSYKLDSTSNFWGELPSVKCGEVDVPAPIPPIIRTVVLVIKIITPLTLIIMGMVDVISSVTAHDEKKMKESQIKFVKRLLSGALVFLLVTMVQFLVSIVADNTEDSNSLARCIDCIMSDAEACSVAEIDN